MLPSRSCRIWSRVEVRESIFPIILMTLKWLNIFFSLWINGASYQYADDVTAMAVPMSTYYSTDSIQLEIDFILMYSLPRTQERNALKYGFPLIIFPFISFSECIEKIATTTGIFVDPVYSSKAAYRMIKMMNGNQNSLKGKKVLFIHTGESWDINLNDQ